MARTRSSSLLSLLFVLFSTLTATAQWDLTIIPQVLPPYSANYTDYFSDPSQVQITIVNTSGEIKNVYLAGSIATLDGSIRVSTSGNTPWAAPPLQVMPGTNMFTGIDLQPAVQSGGGNVDYEGITEEQIVLGLLPEGTYILCLHAYDFGTGEQLSDGELGCSNPFTILTAQPPTLLAPPCEEAISALSPQIITFNWILPQGQPAGAIVNYKFRLVKIFDAIDAQNALEASTDVVYEETTIMPMLLYDGTKPPLQVGQQYAWWVQATTLTNDVLFENQGYSPPCTFTYESNTSDDFILAYPFPGDTLPWSNLPIIARFEPHAAPDQTGRFHSKLNISKDGASPTVTERKAAGEDILWNSGPFLSQRYLLQQAGISTVTFTEDEARHINMYRNDISAAEVFQHGSRYDLDATIRTDTYSSTDTRYGDVTGHFVSGMGRPVPLSPSNNALIPLDGPDTTASGVPIVKLNFKTAEQPAHLLPPYPIWIIPGAGIAPTQTTATIQERWRLQISREPAFTNVIHTQDGMVGETMTLGTSSCDEACKVAALYKAVEVVYNAADTGWYYWRIGWLKNIADVDGATYHDCTVQRFRIQGDTPASVPDSTETVRQAECLAESRHAPTPLTERVPVSTIAIGDTVEVGLFKMVVQQITNSGGFASGEGRIDVPVMRASLRVGFTGVQINARKRLYHGSVKGLYDNAGIIPEAFIQGSAMATGFSPEAAQGIDDFLNGGGRLVSQFVGNSPMGLPIGIDTDVPGGRFVIGILAAEFTDTIARLNAGMALPMHDVGTTVGLGNMAIPFHPDGIGDVSEEGTLYMLGDINVSIGADSLRFKGARFTSGFSTVQDSGTFVAWDCKGFRAVTIDAEYRFSPDNLREDLADGNDGPNKVIGAIRVRTGRGGFMGRVNFNKPFHLANAKGWGFQVQEAWLDFASYANPPGLMAAVQQIGATNLPLGANAELPAWNGLLVKRTLLRMPQELERLDGTGRLTAQVDNLIYSYGQGLSAQVKVANIIGPDQGTLSGWGFSMDTLQLDIISNVFSQGGFKGLIHVPCTDTLLAYSAMIQQDITTSDVRMEFLLHPNGQLNIPMVVGQLSLLETSTVQAIIGDDSLGTFVKAELNGTLNITAELPQIGMVDFKLIKFEHLTFQTNEPYTNADGAGVFSLASPQKFMGGPSSEADPVDGESPTKEGRAGGFPVSLTRVDMERRTEDGTPIAGISFDLNLKLTGETNAFRATTRFSILGELNTSSLHHWGHHSVELDSIGISGNTGAVRVQGSLVWYRSDPVFGDGIKGQLQAGFLNEKVQVKAAAQFGNVNNMSYWYVDAMGAWQNGISPGSAFNVYGFGGGAWYHMKRTSPPVYALELTVDEVLNQDNEDHEPGFTPSGVKMVPDAATLFGFQATVVFGDGASGRAYNGDVSAGMTFTASGGVSTAFLNGSVYLMSERDDREYVPIWGEAAISFDFPNDVFSANFSMHVDVANGMVVGSGEANLAGEANILITPDTWHFHVGKPAATIGLKFAGFIQGQFYFMVGKDLPQALPPPAEVLGIVPPGYWVRPDHGVAFGARVAVRDTVQFLLFKLRMGADIGFDIAFFDAGEMECEGIGDPGIQGWYAQGQLYAYITAGLSLYVDLWFTSGEKHLLDLTAAAAMQGAFANPSWARGAVYGSFNILGGAVSGSVNFPFSLGDPCVTPSSGILSGLNPIGDVTPHDQAGMPAHSIRVDCGVQPQAALNMHVNTTFNLTEVKENGQQVPHSYRLLVDKFELKNTVSGATLSATINVASSKMDITLAPNAYMVPNTVHTIFLRIKAEEMKNGEWKPSMDPLTNKQVAWEKLNTFRTDDGIKELRAQDIDYTYPFPNQRFLLQDECRAGVIQCRANLQTQPVFKSPYGRKRIFKAMFTPKDGGSTITQEITVVNNEYKTWLQFTIPSVVNLATYKLLVVARDEFDASNLSVQEGPAGGGSSGTSTAQMPGSYAMTTTLVNDGSASLFSNTVKVRMRTITGYTLASNETRIYDYYFRTSQFNTLEAKVAALQNTETVLNAPDGFQTLTPSFSGEKFDVFDVNPFAYSGGSVGPMVKVKDPHTDYWYTRYVKPVLFDYYDAVKARQCASGTLTTLPNYMSWQMHVNPAPPLSPGETAYSPMGQSGSGNMSTTLGDGPAPIPLPQVRLYMIAPQFAYWNHAELRSITIELDANCNRPGGERLGDMGDELRTMRDRFLNTPYKVLYKGQYGAQFSFIAPTCRPAEGDVPEDRWDISRATTLYTKTTGPSIPIDRPTTGPGGSGTGGMQVGNPSPPPAPPPTRSTGSTNGGAQPAKP